MMAAAAFAVFAFELLVKHGDCTTSGFAGFASFLCLLLGRYGGSLFSCNIKYARAVMTQRQRSSSIHLLMNACCPQRLVIALVSALLVGPVMGADVVPWTWLLLLLLLSQVVSNVVTLSVPRLRPSSPPTLAARTRKKREKRREKRWSWSGELES